MKKKEIYMLGRFMILVNGKNIIPALGSSKKKIALMHHLLLNKGSSMSVYTLFDCLWPNDYSSNPESSLKTLVSRLRQDLKNLGLDGAIVTKPGAYMWNEDLNCTIDIVEFEKMCEKALRYDSFSSEANQVFQNIIVLYKDDLLSEYSSESWIVPKSTYYHELYLKVLHKYLDFLFENKKYIQTVNVAQKGLKIDKNDAISNKYLSDAYLKQGMEKEACTLFNKNINLGIHQLDHVSPDEVLTFYEDLVSNDSSSVAELEVINSELRAALENNNAFVCDYITFKNIYALSIGNLNKINITAFLMLVSVVPIAGEPLSPGNFESTMDVLLELLVKNMRSEDCICRYSPEKFALFTPAINQSALISIMDTVENQFYKNENTKGFVVKYKIKPIE